ncbi:hypothetical protein F5Y06DRAFT_297970 [Hypoxylon sp. FL0890]|nr:hypothetical protein F5Y06DRAFT_297970 [Hypoxylon sp. FL0890]
MDEKLPLCLSFSCGFPFIFSSSTAEDEASIRNRTTQSEENTAATSNQEVPTPTKKQSWDRGTSKSRSFYKADHKVLKKYAKHAGNKIEIAAQHRDYFNKKYEKVLRNKGKLEGHLQEAKDRHRGARALHRIAAVHSLYR